MTGNQHLATTAHPDRGALATSRRVLHPRQRGLVRTLTAALAAATISFGGLSAVSASAADDNLNQVVNEDEMVAPAGEATVVTDGHIDLGPLMVDGKLDFFARDDRTETPVWRHLEDMVFQLGNTAEQVLPEGGDYDFTGAKAGQTVWAVPQTQVAGVPWLGWSTQSPPVTKIVDRGINLEFGGHQGDGQFTLFIQSGNFGAPQQLWTSTNPDTQAVWVDLKTHTHANWVFTQPGVHLVKVTLKAKMLDGTEVAVPKVLRFAVGDTDPAAAAKATWQGDDTSSVAVAESAAPQQQNSSSNLMWVTLGLIAVGVLAAIAAGVIMMRSRRLERRVQERLAGGDRGDNDAHGAHSDGGTDE